MGEEETWGRARRLYVALLDHAGAEPFADVVRPWLDRAEGGYRTALGEGAALLARTALDGPDERCRDVLWELYALSRVSDALLSAFQPEGEDEEPWSPSVPLPRYVELFGRLGMTSFEETAVFDPVLHEIVDVEQSADPEEPIRITEVVWPGLWMGDLLFNRAGVRVRSGVRNAERGVADRSPLYWAHWRRHRPTVDQSMGWGHNSQWRTDIRVDLRTENGYELNACARGDVDDTDGFTDAALTAEERRDLLCHRCLVRTPVNAAELSGSPGWETDLYPFDGRLSTSAA